MLVVAAVVRVRKASLWIIGACAPRDAAGGGDLSAFLCDELDERLDGGWGEGRGGARVRMGLGREWVGGGGEVAWGFERAPKVDGEQPK